MHDPTEGGVRAALHELAYASGVAVRVDLDQVPIRPETVRICRHFDLDPLGLIGSGALLVAIAAGGTAALLRAWARQGIPGRVIGRVERGQGVRATRNGRPTSLPWIVRDEIIKALGAIHGRGGRRLRG
jgi:hydrogenase expression/formation protein HypE